METHDIPNALFRAFPLPAYAWELQGDHFVLVDFNDAASEITDGRVAGLIGRKLEQVYSPGSSIVDDIERCHKEKGSFQKEIDYEFVSVKQSRILKTTYSYIHPDVVMVYTEDVTDLRHTTEKLRTQEGLLRAIVNGISEAVIAVDYAGQIAFVNRSALRLFEYKESELIGSSIELLVPLGSRSDHVDLRLQYMEQPRTRQMGRGMNLTARRKDGREFPVEIGLDYVNVDGTASVVALITDITERRRTEAEVERAALHDPLTGLLNRRALLSSLEAEHARAARYRHSYSIILGDVDHFKQLNDTYGHDFGDTVLVAISDTLRSIVRGTDLVSRWGGEEFLILLPETGLRAATAVAEKLRSAVGALSFATDNDESLRGSISITMSLGVVDSRETGQPRTVISLADQNLYRAKAGGRDQVVSG